MHHANNVVHPDDSLSLQMQATILVFFVTTSNQEARACQRALNFRKRFGCLGQARGLAAHRRQHACMWLVCDHPNNKLKNWGGWGKMRFARFLFSTSCLQEFKIYAVFGVVSKPRQGAKSQSHLHTYLPMLLWHWCPHVRRCQCASVHSHIQYGNWDPFCLLHNIGFIHNIPARIQGSISERQLICRRCIYYY